MSNPKFTFLDDETALYDSRKRRRVLRIDDEEEEEDHIVGYNQNYGGTEKEDWDLSPLGEPIEVLHEGTQKTSSYSSLVYNGVQFHLEDTVLLEPHNDKVKPYVGIIKEIMKTGEEPLKILMQWLYRPEEVVKRGGGSYQPCCTREFLLSFHHDEVHAESIKHACVVHFVPLTKQIPDRKKHPGFVVQYVYDFLEKKIYNIEDRDSEDADEIDQLLRKTIQKLGDLPDVVQDLSSVDNGLNKFESCIETSKRTSAVGSEYYSVLSSYKLLKKTRVRDKWLEKLLESVQSICTAMNHNQNDKEERKEVSKWPREVVSVVAALEEAAMCAFSASSVKYNYKMRQLVFNLKNNDVLAQRLLKKELEPAQLLKMTPKELKTGLIAEEMPLPTSEPEGVGYMQMTEASCTNCSEKQVAVINIFQGGSRSRYQMECQACGTSWTDVLE